MNEHLLTTSGNNLNQHSEENYPNFLTAHDLLEKYLKDLPENIFDFRQSFEAHDVFYFKQLIKKLVPEMKSVGLNELSDKLKDLDAKCVDARDMVLHETQIEAVIKDITASRESTSRILNGLKEFLLQ
jgi:hypothetical protein